MDSAVWVASVRIPLPSLYEAMTSDLKDDIPYRRTIPSRYEPSSIYLYAQNYELALSLRLA